MGTCLKKTHKIVRKNTGSKHIISPERERKQREIADAITMHGTETVEKIRVYIKCERCGATSTNGVFKRDAVKKVEMKRTSRCSHCGYKIYAVDMLSMPVVPSSVPSSWNADGTKSLEQVLNEQRDMRCGEPV